LFGVRKTIAVLITGGCLLLGLAAASPALAGTRPGPIQLLCSASAHGGTLTGGVCVLPARVAGGANAYDGIIAVSNPNAGDTFNVISGIVPPGLTVLPQYGSGTIVTGTLPRPERSCLPSR
jgi:hypothetical protein